MYNMQNAGYDAGRFPAQTPLAMSYVPMQDWETPFEEPVGFAKGTIFPSLYFPFMDMKPMCSGEAKCDERKG